MSEEVGFGIADDISKEIGMGNEEEEQEKHVEWREKQLYEAGADMSHLPPEQQARYILEDAVASLRVGNTEVGRRKVVVALKLIEQACDEG